MRRYRQPHGTPAIRVRIGGNESRVGGAQGILGGQAHVEGVQGTWTDLTRNVNVRLHLLPHLSSSLILQIENGLQLD